MHNLILISTEDPASKNISTKLHELVDWKKLDISFDNKPIEEHSHFYLATIDEMHIHADNIDSRIKSACGINFDTIIVASRHQSKENRRTLTVHPIGNFGEPLAGGKNMMLTPTAPHLMCTALRELKKVAKGLPYDVSLECTHHGPLVNTKTFFIEIGSNMDAWNDPRCSEAIAKTILSIPHSEFRFPNSEIPTAVGVGKGHYVPRLTDKVLEEKVNFGHILPNYAIPQFSRDIAFQMKKFTDDTKNFYIQQNAGFEEDLIKIRKTFEELEMEELKI